MSAGQTTRAAQTGAEAWARSAGGAYRVVDERTMFHFAYGGFIVIDERGCLSDRFRTRSGAESAARSLNRGAARVDSHAIVGCKVVAS